MRISTIFLALIVLCPGAAQSRAGERRSDVATQTTRERVSEGVSENRRQRRGSRTGDRNRSPAAVVDAWMESPAHCVNIMTPTFDATGIGHGTSSADGGYGHDWTQKFGTR